MRTEISKQLNNLTTIIFLAVAALTPLIFATLTTDFYETPKLVFLLVAVSLLLLIKGVSWVMGGKVSITRTPVDVPLLLFLAVVLISTFISPLRYISLFGNLPRIHGSASTWVLYILFYFLITSHLRSTGQVKKLLQALLASGVVLSAVSILTYFGAHLPIPAFQAANFTPTGSSFSTNSILVLLLPILLVATSGARRLVSSPIAISIASLFALTLALTGDFAVIVAGAVTYLLTIYFGSRTESLKLNSKTIGAYIPLVVFVLVFLLGKISAPGNILYTRSQNFPRELELPLSTAWKVSASAFRDSPLFGTGPSTYLFDFTSYKPVEYNATNLWNIRFDSSFDELLQIFATSGFLGLMAFILFCITVVSFSVKAIQKHGDDTLIKGVALAAISGVVLLALHPSTLVLVVVLLIIVASLMALNKSEYDKVEELTIGIKAWNPTRSDLIAGDALPMVLMLAFIALLAFVYIKAVPMVLADYHHRLALDAASSRGLVTYNELVQSERLNPNVDLYRTDLAQTNFALANAIASAKGPTSASPSGSLTDTDKQNIQTLLSQSINEGRAAAALNPRSSQNWEILASIYRQISGVAQNALAFSLDSYGRSIQQDPLNPLLRLSVGGVYYSVKNYELAVRFFSDAVNLKPDFANGYYNLAIAARDKGDLQTAVLAAQQLTNLVDKKSPDYQTASKLLSDLQAQASSSAQQSTQTPPAAQQTSALEQKQLPKVLNLPEPSSIATPSAVATPSAKPQP